MSPPEHSGSIVIDSGLDSIQVSLVDSTFNEVATGIGGLRATELPPGIYQLRLSAGTVADSRLISLSAGQEYTEVAELAFPTAAPLPGSSTWDPRHELAAEEASQHIVNSSQWGEDAEGGLLVMARGTGESQAFANPPELELIRRTALTPAGDVPTAFGERSIADKWIHGSGPDWVVRAAAVEPGGYGLRVRQGDDYLEQAIWVAPGWQTLVFFPADGDRVQLRRAAISMTGISAPWKPAFALASAQASELALAGLREHRAILPSNLLQLLLEGKFTDPMLGVVGAHSLLLSPTMDFEQFDVVVHNLRRLLGRLPDVAALEVLGAEARMAAGEHRAELPEQQLPRIDWPPMLLSGYAALVRHDAFVGGGSIVPSSPAEMIAGRLRGNSIWTAWNARPIAATAPRSRHSGLFTKFGSPSLGEALREVEATEPATRFVADYLASVADVEAPESFQQILQTELGNPASIAAAITVPLLSVHNAIKTIEDMTDDI